MNIPVLTQLAILIEEIFKSHGPEVAQAAEQAAVTTAVGTAEADPKVQAVTMASVALLTAAQNFKATVNAPPSVPQDAPPVSPATPSAS